MYVYNKIIIDNISFFYQTRSKITKPSSNKFDKTGIQNLIASSSDFIWCEVRDDRKSYLYNEIIRKSSRYRSGTHSYMCVLECAHVAVYGTLDKSC